MSEQTLFEKRWAAFTARLDARMPEHRMCMWLLFLLFLGLRLNGSIAGAWWWIAAPLWGPPLAALPITVVIYMVMHKRCYRDSSMADARVACRD